MSVFMDDEELLHIILDGLPSDYDCFSSAIRTRSDVLSVEELNAKERVIKKRSNGVDPTSMAMAANFHSQGFPRGRGGRNHNQRGKGARGHGPNFGGMNSYFGGGNYSNFGGSQFQNFNLGNQSFPSQFQSFNQAKSSNNQGQSSRPICQICGKSGHSALDCYHRIDFAYQGRHAPAKLASMVANAA